MNIDPTLPWGIAIDYAGRAIVTEAGHTVQIRVYDAGLGGGFEPDPVSGYPAVYVTAQFTEDGELGAQLRGAGQVVLYPVGMNPVAPDQTAVATAVAEALTDFDSRVKPYTTLCARFTETSPTGNSALRRRRAGAAARNHGVRLRPGRRRQLCSSSTATSRTGSSPITRPASTPWNAPAGHSPV